MVLTVGVVLGPVWARCTNSRSGPRTSLRSVTPTVGVVLDQSGACGTNSRNGPRISLGPLH